MKTLNIIACTLVLSFLFYSCEKNESAPVVVDQTFSIAENSPSGTILGTVDASDADEGQIVSFEIIDGNEEESFFINSETGILSVANPTGLDYESNTEIIFKVAVSDNHKKDPLESTANIQVNLIDENEFAPVIKPQVLVLDENSVTGYMFGTIVASDEDSHQVIQYSIVEESDRGYFHLDPISGDLSVKDSAAFDFETNQKFSLDIEVSDGHEHPKTALATVTVNINDVLEITDGLVAYFPFNGNANDESGSGIQSQVFGATLTEDRNGKSGSAYSFDGIDDYITLNNDSQLHFEESDFSISVWVKLASQEIKWQGIISAYNSSRDNREFIIAVNNVFDSTYFKIYDQGGSQGDLIWFEKTWEWQMITVTKNTSSIKAYIDGAFLKEAQITSTISNTATRIMFGAIDKSISSPDAFYEGVIDDIYIHRRVLEDWEVKNLYQMK